MDQSLTSSKVMQQQNTMARQVTVGTVEAGVYLNSSIKKKNDQRSSQQSQGGGPSIEFQKKSSVGTQETTKLANLNNNDVNLPVYSKPQHQLP